jgi:hypothetical protein
MSDDVNDDLKLTKPAAKPKTHPLKPPFASGGIISALSASTACDYTYQKVEHPKPDFPPAHIGYPPKPTQPKVHIMCASGSATLIISPENGQAAQPITVQTGDSITVSIDVDAKLVP